MRNPKVSWAQAVFIIFWKFERAYTPAFWILGLFHVLQSVNILSCLGMLFFLSLFFS